MDNARWGAVKRLFVEALAQPEEQRDAWLAHNCPDAELSRDVRGLIASLERAGSFLEAPFPPNVAAVFQSEHAGSSEARRFAPGDCLGRYEIAELLGAGGMGEVYRARDPRLDRIVVLKVLPAHAAARPEWRARLEREARAVSSLNHPHVCGLYDIGQHRDADFLVMEYLEGETLAARLVHGPLPIEDVLAYGSQIADGLGAAHLQGIVHRDLKPANIMLTATGVKLLDFGVAKPFGGDDVAAAPSSDAAAASLTQHGALIGTAEYMAPEQIRGERVDQRTDVFALGAVLYEMTTGRKAFGGEERARAFDAILNREVTPMRQVRRRTPRALDRVVGKCLVKEPGGRYQAAADVGRELSVVAARRRRLQRGRWLAAASVVLSIGLGLTWSFMTRNQQAPSGAGGKTIMLAVLPFANQSGDPNQDYLSGGLTDGLITGLTRLHPERVGVIGHTSAVRYRQTRKDTAQIDRDLGVDYFIEGSAARTGRRVQIGVRLARARDQTQVWANRYDRELDDVPTLQADIARSIARELGVALTPQQAASLDRKQPIDPEAHDHYLRGRYLWNQQTGEGLRRAVDQFEAATRKDPNYAAAYAGIADASLLLASDALLPSGDAFARARAAATKALELDADRAEAHVSLAGVDDWERRWADAERGYRQALRLNPNDPTARQRYANHLSMHGRHAEGRAQILRARELDPLSLSIQVNVANIFLLSRDYDRAIDECRKTLEMDPELVTARWVLGRARELRGEYRQAIEELQRGLALEPTSTLLRAAMARTYALDGAPATARALLRGLQDTPPRRDVSALDLASVYVAVGQVDETFALLDRAVDERAQRVDYVKVDPAFDRLRPDPRFGKVVRRLGLG